MIHRASREREKQQVKNVVALAACLLTLYSIELLN